MSLSPRSEHSELQRQLLQVRTKYEQQVKKNNNLLKMNSNLMRQNESYLNCFSKLKKWSNTFFVRCGQQQIGQEFEDSCIDVEEQGQQFINRLTQMIDRKIEQLTANNQLDKFNYHHSLQSANITTPTNNDNNNFKNNSYQTQHQHQQKQFKQREQCIDCIRWKQMYIKQTKQTIKLQKLIDDSAIFDTQKLLNFAKLKDDTIQLLQGYLKFYRKGLLINDDITIQSRIKGSMTLVNQNDKLFVNSNSNINSTLNNHHNKQTVRPKEKTKEKRQGSSSGHKNKKVTNTTLANSNNQYLSAATKQPSPFSKQRTSRNNVKYTIQLSPQKSSASLNQQEKINNNLSSLSNSTELSKYLNDILTSYSQLSKSLQNENNQLKQQLKDLTEMLNIYRQRERNQILFK